MYCTSTLARKQDICIVQPPARMCAERLSEERKRERKGEREISENTKDENYPCLHIVHMYNPSSHPYPLLRGTYGSASIITKHAATSNSRTVIKNKEPHQRSSGIRRHSLPFVGTCFILLVRFTNVPDTRMARF